LVCSRKAAKGKLIYYRPSVIAKLRYNRGFS